MRSSCVPAGTERVTASASLTQAGKLFGAAVRQTRIMPLALRNLAMSIDSSEVGAAPTSSAIAAAASVTRAASGAIMPRGESPDAAIGTADAVPEPEIKPIIAPVPLMVSLMVARGDEPTPQLPPPHERRKDLPAHMVGDPHNRHDRQHQAERRDMDLNR